MELPGPGNYNELSAFGKNATSASIRGKPKDIRIEDIPGPGTYSAANEVVKGHAPSFRMGTSSRDRGGEFESATKGQDEMPGPGQYELKLKGGVAYKFDKNEKEPHKDDIPGPGHYYIPVKILDVPKYNIPNQNEEFKWV